LQTRDLGLKLLLLSRDFFLLGDEVKREFFDFGEERGLDVAEVDAGFGDVRRGGNAGEVFVGFDVRFDFGERRETVVVGEHVIGPASRFDDDLLGFDRAVDGELVLRVGRADADIALRRNSQAFVRS
jgi:hypothetical protein